MKNKEYWKNWAVAAGMRALRTMAQTAIGAIGASAIISEINWVVVASSTCIAGLVSVLMSIQCLPEVPEEKK